MFPKHVIAFGVVVNDGGTAPGSTTVTSLEQLVTVSVIVTTKVPNGTPENTFPVSVIDAGFGLIV